MEISINSFQCRHSGVHQDFIALHKLKTALHIPPNTVCVCVCVQRDINRNKREIWTVE